MKLRNFFIIFFIFALSFVACEKSTLKITQPEDSFFLNKVKTLGNNFTVSGGGKDITIKNSDGTEINKYNFEKKITGLAGIYKKENATNGYNDAYIFIFPLGNEAHTVSVSEKEKKALEDIINIIGEENSGGIIGALTTNEGFNKENVDSLKSNLSDDKKRQLDSLISSSGLNNTNFGNPKEYS